MGGPIIKDRLWYRVAARDEGQHRSIPNIFPNLNAGDPTKRLYAPDRTSEVRGAESWRLYTVRLTIQATSQRQDQRALGRAAPVQRLDLQHRRWTAAAASRSPVTGVGPLGLGGLSSTTSPEIGGYLQRASARAAGDLVGNRDEPDAVRSRLRRVSGAVRSL